MVDQHPIVGSWRSGPDPGHGWRTDKPRPTSADGGIVVASIATPAAPIGPQTRILTSALGEWQASDAETVGMLFRASARTKPAQLWDAHRHRVRDGRLHGDVVERPFQIDISDATGVTGEINGTVSATRISVSGSG